MEDATLGTGGSRPVLRFERHLAKPPSEVWRSLTVREELKGWFPCDIVAEDWRPGARLRFVFGGGEWDDLEGEVLECDEPRLLAFTWGPETLRFELSEHGDGTRLVLTDEIDPEAAARNAAGWEVCLEMLDGRTPAPDLWRRRFDHYAGDFSPRLGAQAGPPERPS